MHLGVRSHMYVPELIQMQGVKKRKKKRMGIDIGERLQTRRGVHCDREAEKGKDKRALGYVEIHSARRTVQDRGRQMHASCKGDGQTGTGEGRIYRKTRPRDLYL